MKKFTGCDLHKKFSVFVTLDERGGEDGPIQVNNRPAELLAYLQTLPAGTPVAVEASGSWYWFVDLLEEQGLDPRLVNPLEAKKKMPGRKKTDRYDAAGLAQLLRDGGLPEVWIPSAALRDLRGLMRARLALRGQQTTLKNRIRAALRRYGVWEPGEAKDLFRGRGRVQLYSHVAALPLETRLATRHECQLVVEIEHHIQDLEERIQAAIARLGAVQFLRSLPGVGRILSATIALEIGDVARFASAEKLACYSGLTPSIKASGGKSWRGPTSRVSNHYLRWAFIEAANCIVLHQRLYQERHVFRLYQRLRAAKGHAKAAVAVARHLAEASWWMLTKKQDYREPAPASIPSSENGSARPRV